ncbi:MULTISPECIES: hypothetical protein [Arthrobacter]|uniref:Uncharacterized protein n=1 Tax=Arthrobacter horti TaxID=3068273 RepID=A0ABT9ISS1_9MICC|nr:hypothetical protein [Arthrobacter sp. YJM1]MDP5228651.1 hypothetical protein [Arthrobacter sp. YJM1]
MRLDGNDDADRLLSAWVQEQWVASARGGAPCDAAWPMYGDEARIMVIDSPGGIDRIDDDPIVQLIHANR